MKAASDLGLPLIGVGLLYQGGYFYQYLKADGWQQERWPVNDFYTLPIQPVTAKLGKPLVVKTDFPGKKLCARIWRALVDRIPLYLLDTNVKENSLDHRTITDTL